MPKFYKKRAKKGLLIDVLREAYITVDDAHILYDRIYEAVLAELQAGNGVNLFNLVEVNPVVRAAQNKMGAFGRYDLALPRRVELSTHAFPKLNKEWKRIQAQLDPNLYE